MAILKVRVSKSTDEQNVEKCFFFCVNNMRKRTRQVLSEETLDNTGVRYEAPTRHYLKNLSQETGVPQSYV